MFTQTSPDQLCIFCGWVEVRHWDDGEHGRCLSCGSPRYMRGMAKERGACCLFEREPGVDDELERELAWGREPAHPHVQSPVAAPAVPACSAPVHMPAPRPPRQLQPLSRSIMADYHPDQATRRPRSLR